MIRDQIKAMRERYEKELAGFVGIPTVSGDPARGDDCRAGAEAACEFIRKAGGDAQVVPTGGAPRCLR